ncbi:hypothetical protein [Desulfurobacterium atlanticum]|uniref:Uncharacterized protein n=1 Tax=Desulfurobacterium atlanticum TaxID=240169 RepID=A0A239A1N7_9BACT|nr:hypothetical protein [Desulfurobacterium atlanticum]SNR89565.1 hypothetical protein SAMN06265340_11432 [Desulfurobacterium atlanticum]
MNKINLDKICAEYGMDLLTFPESLYNEAKKILQGSNNKEDFEGKNYDDSDWRESLKEFKNYNLINPLQDLKNRVRKDNQFDKLKEKPSSFNSSTFETEITKALGILVEDGPFAYMIWLKSQDREPHRAMLIQTARILAELKVIEKIETNENLKERIEKAFLNLSGKLPKLLFAKTVLEKMLIYARYKAKAMENKVSEG